MKKKIAMRVASLALCVVFTASVFGAPKAKAVAVESAFGVAVVATFFAATGLVLSASAGSTREVVSTGVDKIVTDFCAAVGDASQTAADFYGKLVSNTSIRPDGTLALTATAVLAISELVSWFIGENGLDKEGDTAVAMPGTSEFYFYNELIFASVDSVWTDKDTYPYVVIFDDIGKSYGPFVVFESKASYVKGDSFYFRYPGLRYEYKSNEWKYDTRVDGAYDSDWEFSDYELIWSNHDVLSLDDGSIYLNGSVPVPVGDNIQNQLEVTRTPEFTQPATELTPESEKQMYIGLGLTSAPTMEDFSVQVLDRVVAGDLATTYEIVDTQTGEGTDPEPDTDEDESVYPYFPVLSGIRNRLDGLADSIVDGILEGVQGLFVPSEAYMEALPAQITDTFDERTGFLTYPFSLLPDFVDRLSAPSDDWILKWPQIAEPFTGTILFQQGSWNVTAFVQANVQIKRLYDLWRLIAKALMSFGFIGLCYNKYRSVVGDRYGEG